MDDRGSDPLAEVINLLAAPIASGIRSVEQVKRGVDEVWRAVENLNRTMETLNETAQRVNALLADIEEPVRAAIPQLTRTIKTADEITQRLDGPIRAAAPNIERVVDTFAAPGFAEIPSQIADALGTLGEMSRRLSPLAAFAENAGGLFGGLRIPGVGGPRPTPDAARPTTATAGVSEPTPAERSAAARSGGGAATAPGTTKRPAKRAATKRPAKQRATKKSAAPGSRARKASPKTQR